MFPHRIGRGIPLKQKSIIANYGWFYSRDETLPFDSAPITHEFHSLDDSD